MDLKMFRKENLNIWIAPAFVLILTVILIFLNIHLGIFGIFATVVSIYNAIDTYTKKKVEFKQFVDTLDISFEGFTKSAIFTMPFPIVVLDESLELAWYNSRFKNLVKSKESLVEKKIFEVLPVIEKSYINKDDHSIFDIEFDGRNFEVHKNTTVTNTNKKMTLLYFIDSTEKVETLRNYENEKMVLMNIRIDNYEEIYQNVSSEKRPILFAEIDSIITSYFHKHGCFIKKNEAGKYFAVFYKESLEKMFNDKFSFVEEVRNVNGLVTMPPTLSIGIGYNQANSRENERESNAAVDIALGRGGDQIVIKSGDKLEYFGGKNKATEKRTKVKARVVAHALSLYTQKASEVFISGHINPDMDSFGSALGLWHSVMKKNKAAYIVLSEVTPSIKNIYEYATKNIENLEKYIITPQEAFELSKSTSLLIVTDNHRKSSIEEPRLFEIVNSVVVIDHHRRGNDYIENSTLNYEDASASSASELVTEMLMYMHEKVEINKVVADCLLAGIMTDTKNFNQQTGIRTFEAAAVLKQNGADNFVVKKLFSDDFDTLKIKAEIISNAEIYNDKFIIGSSEHEIEGSTLIASLAADELTTIQNIEASFVFVKANGKAHCSARSLGDVSVQLIMEKLGGGGHRTMAATQIETSIEQAIEMLKKVISEYN